MGVGQGVVEQVSSPFHPSGRRYSLLQGPVASIPGNPDSHAVSTLTDVTVDDLDRVERSTYVDGDSGGQ